MDQLNVKEGILPYIKKYRYIMLILLMGLLIMIYPDRETEAPKAIAAQEEKELELQDELADILSKIAGAGRVEVLLTQEEGESVLYQTDEDISGDEIRRDTILIQNTGKEEAGLVRQINPPVYRGAIILCQGAANASIKLSIVEAVMAVTGLTSDRITVLKMK